MHGGGSFGDRAAVVLLYENLCPSTLSSLMAYFFLKKIIRCCIVSGQKHLEDAENRYSYSEREALAVIRCLAEVNGWL